VWVILSLVVFVFILMHGLTMTPAMRWLDRRHGRQLNWRRSSISGEETEHVKPNNQKIDGKHDVER
jgi:hypothetical protein